jgi:hypothetical protein
MNMSRCEIIEINISALLDGEADLHEQVEVIEHILTCSSCRQFFDESRELQDLVDLLPAEGKAAVLESNISKESDEHPERGAFRQSPRGSRQLPVWMQVAAVLLLLMTSFWFGHNSTDYLANNSGPAPAIERSVDVQLASNPGGMDESEFIALTLELLQADSRYQRKMYEILGAIQDDVDYSGGEIVTARGAGEGNGSLGRDNFNSEQDSEGTQASRTMIY